MAAESVLVTGAGGFIGRHLSTVLAEEGFHVTVSDLPGADLSYCEELGMRALQGDLMSREFAAEVVRGIDGVFNLAAAFDLGLPRRELVSINVGITTNLAQAASRAQVKMFVHYSTCDVFGLKRKGPTNEDESKKPRNSYSYSKLLSEDAAMRFSGRSGMRVSVVRPTFVYGPGAIYTAGVFVVLPALIKRYVDEIPLPRGGPRINTIQVKDLARATIRVYEAGEKANGLSFNVADDSRMCAFDFLKSIFEPFGITCSRGLRIPWALLEATGRLCEILPACLFRRLEAFLKKKWDRVVREEELAPMLSPRLEKDFVGFIYGEHLYSNERIKSLGWKPEYPTFCEGWGSTVRWYRESGWIP